MIGGSTARTGGQNWIRDAVVCAIVASAIINPLAAQEVIVEGRVKNEVSGRPVSEVSVIHDNLTVAVTDADGRFATPPLPVEHGTVTVAFRRLGFAPAIERVHVVAGAAVPFLEVNLHPVPTVLEEIVVDGQSLTIKNPGLVGFYERRAEGIGRYITQAEIDRAKSWDLSFYFRRAGLRTESLRRGCFDNEPTITYLDGIRFFDLGTIQSVLPPTTVGGIELYPRETVHRLPAEFIPAGPFCMVVMVWTRAPLGPAPAVVGVFLGPQLTGPARNLTVGAQFLFPLRRGGSSWQFHISVDVASGSAGDRGHGLLAVSFRPAGFSSPWYAGGGITIAKTHSSQDFDVRPTVLTGVFFPVGALRPFVEARLSTSSGNSAAFVLTGINLQFGPR